MDIVVTLTKSEIAWIEQEAIRETRSIELLLGTLTEKERRAICNNVVERCLAVLRKEKGVQAVLRKEKGVQNDGM